MNRTTVQFDQVSALTNRDIAYQIEPKKFSTFIGYDPTLEGLKEAAEARKKFPINRNILVDQIKQQYESNVLSILQKKHLENLSEEHTFTVITAHQPSLFTGPLYYIYKIVSTINLAKHLTEKLDYKVVPIFILGSEDHDFEEVNHLNIFNKELVWNNFQKGPVGRYNTEGIEELINNLSEILGNNDHSQALISKLRTALANTKNYNEFSIHFINDLFSEYGLIVVNMDNKAFKQSFAPIVKKEIIERTSQVLISTTQNELSNLGFNPQAHAREINLFYMMDGLRERIVFEDNKYIILNTQLEFTEEEILIEIENHPERFSPNVALRPLYQESIFPNLAYVGGGGELAYWMERKSQFEAFNIFYPCLIRRNSVLLLKKNQIDLLNKMNLKIEDLFLNEDQLVGKYLKENVDIEINIKSELGELSKIFTTLKEKAKLADKSLEGFVEAEHIKSIKQIEQIESRIVRAIKKNEETSINQIKNMKAKLFANNGLQERSENFMAQYSLYGEDFFEELLRHLDPLDKNFVILSEN
jgi:bacillithiol synthase